MSIRRVSFIITLLLVGLSVGQYLPEWSSLDTRPLPQWYDQAKFGIFIHWGVYSVPSTISEWFWFDWKTSESQDAIDFMQANYPPDFTYQDFAEQFHAEFFDPDQWADLFQASGAKYVVLTSKHHEGYTLWPSSYSWNWNSQDVGPAKDLVGLLAESIRNRTDLHFGLYHSLFEWYNPVYLQDKQGGFVNSTFPSFKTMPELYELVNNYEPEIIWSDGGGDASDDYWGSKQFIAWLYNESPVKDTVVVNDRWGQNDSCTHGDFYTCSDRYNPGHLLPHKWENAMTIDKYSWGYRREAVLEDYYSVGELLWTLISTVSCGGNLLLNVGPTADGRIIPVLEERLRQIGQWLAINGEAIYDTQPWTYQNDTVTPDIWYTTNKSSGAVYAFFYDWPDDYNLNLGAPFATNETVATMLESINLIWFPADPQGLYVILPNLKPPQPPGPWTIKLEGVN